MEAEEHTSQLEGHESQVWVELLAKVVLPQVAEQVDPVRKAVPEVTQAEQLVATP